MKGCKILLLAAALLCGGCSIVGPRVAELDSVDAQLELIDDGVKENERLARAREALETALAEALEAEESAAQAEEPRFDLAVAALPAQTFFRSLVRDTPYNVVVHPDVAGSITLDLKGVTVPEVLELVRDVYGYDYLMSANLVRVYPDVVRTEIFQIDYLNVKRSGRSEVQVSAGSVSDVGPMGNNAMNAFGGVAQPGLNVGGAGGAMGGPMGMGQGMRNGAGLLGTVVNTDGEAKFWEELETTLETIVGGDEGGRVMVTPQAGLAVVRAKPDALAAVRQYLSQVQSALHRQVILEAKILEVTLREGFQSGINWNTFGEDSGGTFEPTLIENADGSFTLTNGSSNDVAGEITSGAADFFNPLGTAFTLNASFEDFEAAIDLLSTQGSVQVLSSPRIATVNNQKAVIKVGSDEFFVTAISTNTITAGASLSTLDAPQLTPFFSGIALDVTPQISAEGDIILHVHPTVSEVAEQLKNISGEIVPLAASTIRESDSIVRARNGQIVVIGGLMQNSSSDDNAGVPLLKRLPGIGHLFQQQARSSIKSELVILLKPLVVDHSGQQQALRQSRDRLDRLRKLLDRPG